ncbi:glycosyltransferase [Dehalobacterium formicoaceticum]|uniref:Glycosyltransferase n=1 Tax=Dehalobacterium formicoaceticum TaxID=51515 RepID=A0ABT1Y5P7_9FIRM|nr:glycosyltransferase [Dehalobacterium formicoaceticum]MCR6546201.1 glycosyltransferase [Dehalobacterium formicoaceticum]
MKLLVLTRSPWDDTNSLGNTMTNFWAGWNSEDISNIYCRAAKPNNNVCQRYYSITEKELLRSIFKPSYLPGKTFIWNEYKENTNFEDKEAKYEEKLYSFFRKNSFVIAQWGQEFLWKIGKWNNSNLDQFLFNFKPDIIFASCFATSYPHKLLWYIKEKTNAKVVLFHADDYLTVDGLGGSTFAWVNRKIRAKRVTQSAKEADMNYCISHKQQEEYSLKLKKEMKLLYKGADFSKKSIYKRDNSGELIRIVYVGSILCGRWKTLGMLARQIKQINAIKPIFELLIYSQYQPSHEAVESMAIDGASHFMGKVPATQVPQVLNDADIVLHVESFDIKERLATRLSFSTKIVDCFHSGRCVFAIGWKEAASIDYLIKNDAALVATDEKSIVIQLDRIINNQDLIEEYAQKAWECGIRNHQIDKIQKGLYEDLVKLVKYN